METQAYSRDTAAQADGKTALPPCPFTRGDIGFWLRRGEQLGRAARWIGAAVASAHKRAAPWRRQGASGPPIDPPPQPG